MTEKTVPACTRAPLYCAYRENDLKRTHLCCIVQIKKYALNPKGLLRERSMYKRARRMLLTGVIIFIASEIYLTVFVSDFRISPAAIIFPVLFMTLNRDDPLPLTGAVTGIVLFILRAALSCARGNTLPAAMLAVHPGALYYFVYSLLFIPAAGNRYTASDLRVAGAAGACDFCSNIFELFDRHLILGEAVPDMDSWLKIFAIAVVRALIAYLCLLLLRQYRSLLKKEEHEQRYRRLYLITADLKSELYLMEKNSRQIEQVMKNAYQLYEKLDATASAPELKNASLDIAREVHDIKKDYYRVIRGIAEEIGKNPDTESMALKDMFTILEETLRADIREKKRDAAMNTEIGFPFHTDKHYQLMSILLNLTTNAEEAADPQRREMILVKEEKQGEDIVFTVSDNGQGIPARRLGVIFEMGYSSKYDEATGNMYRGVGLCSVKQLVEEQLHGTIGVTSEEGKGTVFTVKVPMKELIV